MDLETIKIVSTAISVVAIPIVIAVLGNIYSKAIKERELQGKFVALAVTILNGPSDDNNKKIRKWAAKIITRYSGVKLDEDAQEELVNINLE